MCGTAHGDSSVLLLAEAANTGSRGSDDDLDTEDDTEDDTDQG